jgi:hypothetical protein
VTLAGIKAALKSGVKPAKLPKAKHIGGGCFREAYKVGQWVVKKSHPHAHRETASRAMAAAKRVGVRLATTHKVQVAADTYDVQWFYKRLTLKEFNAIENHADILDARLDLGAYNMGRTVEGALVAFDW